MGLRIHLSQHQGEHESNKIGRAQSVVESLELPSNVAPVLIIAMYCDGLGGFIHSVCWLVSL